MHLITGPWLGRVGRIDHVFLLLQQVGCRVQTDRPTCYCKRTLHRQGSLLTDDLSAQYTYVLTQRGGDQAKADEQKETTRTGNGRK